MSKIRDFVVRETGIISHIFTVESTNTAKVRDWIRSDHTLFWHMQEKYPNIVADTKQ